MIKYIKKFIYKNEKVYKLLRRNAYRFLVRPYIRWRNVPIISITGSNGKTTVTRLLNQIYLSAGYRVGMACTDGVYHDGVETYHDDYSGGLGVWYAAKGRGIDILLAETGRGGIIAHGLGYHKSQVGVVLNVYEDHIDLDGIHTLEQLAEVKATIPKHTDKRGTVVLNGDLKLVRNMNTKTNASVTYFTMDGRQDEFKRCYYQNNGYIYRQKNQPAERIMEEKEVFISLQGMLRYNIANAMAVLAAVDGMQPWVPVPFEKVLSVLREFGKNPHDIMARFTMLRYEGNAVLLCRCKNPEGFRLDIEVIREIKEKFEFDHVIGILTAKGQLRQVDFEAISHTVAPECHYFFIRPPKERYWRFRTGDEIVRFLTVAIPKERILSLENLGLKSIFEHTKRIVDGKCLFVFFNALYEANLNVPELLSEGQVFTDSI